MLTPQALRGWSVPGAALHPHPLLPEASCHPPQYSELQAREATCWPALDQASPATGSHLPACPRLAISGRAPRGQKPLASPPWTRCLWQPEDWNCRWQEPTTIVIPDSRGEHGPMPLAISEQKSLAAPITSESITEKDTLTEHHLMLLSLPWEHTCPAAATIKHSGQCPDA